MHKKLWLTVLFGFTATLSIIAGASAFTAYAYTNEVLPRVYLAGESIGNLSFAEASQQIQRKIDDLHNTKLSIALDDKQASITPVELGVTVDKTAIEKQLLVVNDPWSWARLGFWQRFFKKSDVAISYVFDEFAVRQKIEQTLQVTSVARDATITFANQQLVINPPQNGQSIDVNLVHQALENFFTSGLHEPIKLTYVETAPAISLSTAEKTKSNVEQTLNRPINLRFEDRTFTIPVKDQYGLVDFEPKGSELTWSINSSKTQDYLFGAVARKLNIKMRQKVIIQDTGEISDQGQDGREVLLGPLLTSVMAAMKNQQDTTTEPILISAKTIPLTEKIITPGYIAGLFEGLYLDVNLTLQRIYVLNGTQKQAEWLISSGKRGTPTPVGLFYIKNKISLAQSSLYPGLWMQNWNALSRNPDGSGYEGYGLHKVPCFNASCTLRESLSHLGRPASHGCVRIEDVGAEWVYNNAPVGTPVNIHL